MVKIASLLLVFILLISSSINVNVYFSGLQAKEYTALKKLFKTISIEDEKKIIFIRPEGDFLQKAGFYKYTYSDEFGQLSSSRNWVPIPFFKQTLKEEGILLNVEMETIGINELTEPYDSPFYTTIYLNETLTDAFGK
jgi:hypothetical protein